MRTDWMMGRLMAYIPSLTLFTPLVSRAYWLDATLPHAPLHSWSHWQTAGVGQGLY